MAFEELGEVTVVALGGINKNTGKKNPTQIEGYFLRVEPRSNRFNKEKPQNFYVFRTQNGEEGIYGKTDIDKKMAGAEVGAMTRITATGETYDSGKGNPMKIFKVAQDKSNTLSGSDLAPTEESYDEEEESLDDDTSPDEITPSKQASPPAHRTTNAAAVKQGLVNRAKSA